MGHAVKCFDFDLALTCCLLPFTSWLTVNKTASLNIVRDKKTPKLRGGFQKIKKAGCSPPLLAQHYFSLGYTNHHPQNAKYLSIELYKKQKALSILIFHAFTYKTLKKGLSQTFITPCSASVILKAKLPGFYSSSFSDFISSNGSFSTVTFSSSIGRSAISSCSM